MNRLIFSERQIYKKGYIAETNAPALGGLRTSSFWLFKQNQA
mgnify:CR=1 FL=1